MTQEAVAQKGMEKTPRYAWVILFVVFLASFVVPVNFFKAPVIFPVFMEEFGFTPDTIGWMMSMFTFISILLAFPAAGFAKRFGYRNITIFSISSAIVGGLLGIFAPNAAVLLIGRFLEGLAMGFFGVIAPAMLVPWFTRKSFGLAVGIWGIWMPTGGTIMSSLTPALYNATGAWQSVYWFALGFSVVALIVFLLLYREAPPGVEPVRAEKGAPKEKTPWKKVFSLSLILLGVSFTIFNIACNGTINTFFPTFLQLDMGIDNQTAGLLTSAFTFICLVANAAAGFISDRMGTRKWLIIAGLVGMMIGTWLMFDFVSMEMLWIGLIITAIFQAFTSTCSSASVPEIIFDQRYASYGMAVLGFGAGLGGFIGGLALGWLEPIFGFAMGAHILLVPLLIIATGCMLFVKVR